MSTDQSENFCFDGLLGNYAAELFGPDHRAWLVKAMGLIEADFNRSSDTHLHKLQLRNLDGIDLYLKDEAIHPSGSLKHRLARSLVLYGICGGKIGAETTLIEASSGSTAVSVGYFAALLGLPFIAVVPRGTSARKLSEVTRYGGRVVEVAAAEIYEEAARLEQATNGYYLNQFTNAERATDWRSNNNIAESLFRQMEKERHPTPEWVVVSAGTGGTSATIGRYIRYQASRYSNTRVCVADPENSVFFDGYCSDDASIVANIQSRIEGVGRPKMEPSFLRPVVDRMLKIADVASFATTWWLRDVTGRRFGPSTGLNVYASLILAQELKSAGREGSIVTLICDSGDRYEDSCYDPEWLASNQLNVAPHLKTLEFFNPRETA